MNYICILNLFICYLICINYGVENLQKSNLFCTDSMLETGFTHIILNSTLPLFGKLKWFSIENLTNVNKLHKLISIHSNECLNTTIQMFNSCWNYIRQKFIEYLIPIGNNNDRVIIEKFEQIQRNGTIRTINNVTYMNFLNALCLTACYSRYQKNLEPIINNHIVCPFPCVIQKDCSFNVCKNYGIFTHEYECPCDNSSKWNRDSNECLPDSIYKIRQTRNYPDMLTKEKILRQRNPRNCEPNSKCSKNGTLFCTMDSNYEYTICVCKLDYHGYYCQDKINACLFRIEHHLQPNGGTLIAGNTACNVNSSGNKCIALISAEGDASYQCQCNETHWIPNIELPYPNCLQKLTKCDSVVCVHGFCVSNNHIDQAKCVCNPGYSGLACEEWVGVWSKWSEWDQCRPACGNMRYSLRQRDCLSMKLENKSKLCLGSPIDYVKCSEHLCTYKGISYPNLYSSIQQNVSAINFTFNVIVCVTVVVIWSLLFLASIKSFYGLLKKLYPQRRQIKMKTSRRVTLGQNESKMSMNRRESVNNNIREGIDETNNVNG
ncbi:unnamed protein product [Schistosoma rodhaini]|nr:unnamed protein product [Schistosoma rodhaini]